MIALLRHLGERGTDAIPWSTLRDMAIGDPILPELSLAIASIPLALYCHDREALLEARLQEGAIDWNLTPNGTLPARILAEVLALALLEELDLDHLPLQLLENLDLPPDDLAAQQLQQLQQAYQERYSWAIARHYLQRVAPNPLAQPLPLPLLLALYGVLRSPQDISLIFSLPDHPESPLTGLMAGAIAGSIQGGSRLAADGRQPPRGTPADWGLTTLQDLNGLSDALLAHWAGVYRPLQPPAQTLKGAIAAPQQLRPPS